ncbi:HIG1 domain-containing protein [Madurella fahalii]|uniref:HIG1 domain-containing protein n=1 Tax=Madurella fahalii TaxID=1157608 RepID=A0ABQ0GMB2_9PEZI
MDSPRTSASPSSASPLRLLTRRPALAIAGLALAGAGLGFRHIATTLRDNELAQKNSAARNFYVSVDRSGGGI